MISHRIYFKSEYLHESSNTNFYNTINSIFLKKKRNSEITKSPSNQNFDSDKRSVFCTCITSKKNYIDERAGTIVVHEDRARVVPELQHLRNVPNRWFTLPNLTNTNTITTHASRTRQEIRPIEWLSLEADWDPEDMLLIRMLLPV